MTEDRRLKTDDRRLTFMVPPVDPRHQPRNNDCALATASDA